TVTGTVSRRTSAPATANVNWMRRWASEARSSSSAAGSSSARGWVEAPGGYHASRPCTSRRTALVCVTPVSPPLYCLLLALALQAAADAQHSIHRAVAAFEHTVQAQCAPGNLRLGAQQEPVGRHIEPAAHPAHRIPPALEHRLLQ